MIRKIVPLACLLLLAACAVKTQPHGAAIVPIPQVPPRRAEPPGYIGLTQEALKTRLGAAVFSRKDGTTEMWRYDTKTCRAFFFFTAGQVNHIETIPHGADAAADPACLSAVKKAP